MSDLFEDASFLPISKTNTCHREPFTHGLLQTGDFSAFHSLWLSVWNIWVTVCKWFIYNECWLSIKWLKLGYKSYHLFQTELAAHKAHLHLIMRSKRNAAPVVLAPGPGLSLNAADKVYVSVRANILTLNIIWSQAPVLSKQKQAFKGC